MLRKIREEFENIKSDDMYNQKQKNSKYASLMSAMEIYYKIPLLAGTGFDNLDPKVKSLYLEISNERNLKIY